MDLSRVLGAGCPLLTAGPHSDSGTREHGVAKRFRAVWVWVCAVGTGQSECQCTGATDGITAWWRASFVVPSFSLSHNSHTTGKAHSHRPTAARTGTGE
jgi:hypothetical protein